MRISCNIKFVNAFAKDSITEMYTMFCLLVIKKNSQDSCYAAIKIELSLPLLEISLPSLWSKIIGLTELSLIEPLKFFWNTFSQIKLNNRRYTPGEWRSCFYLNTTQFLGRFIGGALLYIILFHSVLGEKYLDQNLIVWY